MNGIGILYKPVKSDKPKEEVGINAHLHINYWKMPKGGRKGEYHRLLDFGIMVYDMATDIESFFIYMPFQVTKNNLEDLGKSLSTNNFLCTLFGDDYETQTSPNSPYTQAKAREPKKSFWVYTLDDANFEVSGCGKGSLIEIKIKSSPERGSLIEEGAIDTSNCGYNLYIRFRVNSLPQDSIYVSESISNDFLQSAFSKQEMVNFTINGNLGVSTFEELSSKGNFIKFARFHFYFIGTTSEETVSGTNPYKDCRLLDFEQWEQYIKGNNPLKKSCISYHWKVNPVDQKCNIFLSTRYSSYDWCKILKFSFYAITMNLIAGFFLELLFWLVELVPNFLNK